MKRLVSRTYRITSKDGKLIVSSAYVKVHPNKPCIVCRVRTRKSHRGQGLATQVMQEVIKEFGHKYDLKLWPSPAKDGELTKEELRVWYRRFGFKDTHAKMMIRPRSK